MDDVQYPSHDSSAFTGDDLLDVFRLDVTFLEGLLEERQTFSDRKRGLRNVVRIKRWRKTEELGRGGFGIVYLEECEQGAVRAVKEVPKSMGKRQIQTPLRELMAMAAFSRNAANFVQLEGWFESKTHLYIAMEYFELGDLYQCLDKPVAESEAQDIIFQVNEAVAFMHHKGFAHRDLKPANIFVVSTAPNWWVKLGDLGIAKRVKGDSTSLYTSFDGDFMAPEVLGLSNDPSTDEYTNAVDMWGLGCLAFWLLTLRNAIPRRHLLAFCLGKHFLSLEDIKSSEAADYIGSLVCLVPQERLTATAALKHSWLKHMSPDPSPGRQSDPKSAHPADLEKDESFSESTTVSSDFNKPITEQMSFNTTRELTDSHHYMNSIKHNSASSLVELPADTWADGINSPRPIESFSDSSLARPQYDKQDSHDAATRYSPSYSRPTVYDVVDDHFQTAEATAAESNASIGTNSIAEDSHATTESNIQVPQRNRSKSSSSDDSSVNFHTHEHRPASQITNVSNDDEVAAWYADVQARYQDREAKRKKLNNRSWLYRGQEYIPVNYRKVRERYIDPPLEFKASYRSSSRPQDRQVSETQSMLESLGLQPTSSKDVFYTRDRRKKDATVGNERSQPSSEEGCTGPKRSGTPNPSMLETLGLQRPELSGDSPH